MANTLAGVSHDNIARIGLDAFADPLVSLSGFTTDYSNEVVQGTTISTRIVPVAGTVGDLNDTHGGDYNDAIDNQVLEQVQITLGSDPVIAFAFSDQEVVQMNAGVYSDTVKRLIKTHARAVANNVLDAVWAKVDSTFTAGIDPVLAADFGADEMFDARADFVANAGDVDDATCVLQPSYYAALGKDGAIQDNSKSRLETLQSGEVPRVAGFDILEAPSIAGAAGGNTVGFCATPSALAIAMRAISAGPEVEADLVAYQPMVDPTTGALLLYTSWVKRSTRQLVHAFQTQYGIADGVTTSLRRIISATE